MTLWLLLNTSFSIVFEKFSSFFHPSLIRVLHRSSNKQQHKEYIKKSCYHSNIFYSIPSSYMHQSLNFTHKSVYVHVQCRFHHNSRLDWNASLTIFFFVFLPFDSLFVTYIHKEFINTKQKNAESLEISHMTMVMIWTNYSAVPDKLNIFIIKLLKNIFHISGTQHNLSIVNWLSFFVCLFEFLKQHIL